MSLLSFMCRFNLNIRYRNAKSDFIVELTKAQKLPSKIADPSFHSYYLTYMLGLWRVSELWIYFLILKNKSFMLISFQHLTCYLLSSGVFFCLRVASDWRNFVGQLLRLCELLMAEIPFNDPNWCKGVIREFFRQENCKAYEWA